MNVWDAIDTAIKVVVPSGITAFVAMRIWKRSNITDANKEVTRRRHEILENLIEAVNEHDDKMRKAAMSAGFIPHGGPPESRIVRADAEAHQVETFDALTETEHRLFRFRAQLRLQKLLGCEAVLYEYLIACAKFRDSIPGAQRDERLKVWTESFDHLEATIIRAYDELFRMLGANRDVISGRYGSGRDPKFFLDPTR
jgi:hypothetical protein